jgi:transcriptional regulator with XRE-family HTH domain
MLVRVGKCLLQDHLKKFGMTQQELANKLSLSRSQISDYANNRKIMSLKNAKSIAKVIGCTIDDLYEWYE